MADVGTMCTQCGGTEQMEREIVLTLGITEYELTYSHTYSYWRYRKGTFELSVKYAKYRSDQNTAWSIYARDEKYSHNGHGASVAKAAKDMQAKMFANFVQLSGPLGYDVEL
jgi:hypothetical protein